MFSWTSFLPLQKESSVPVYLQIANGIIREIKEGFIKPGEKIPGTRELSETLQVHRKTIVNAYFELDAQGWIYTLPSKGAFVSEQLPEVNPTKLVNKRTVNFSAEKTGYAFRINTKIKVPAPTLRHIKGFHDGPDPRLVPIQQLATAYRSVLQRKSGLHNLSYVDPAGSYDLRKTLSAYLNESRALSTTVDNIFISRGSQMGIYMVSQILLSKGDHVIVGDTNYYYTDASLVNAGAQLVRVPVDDDGIDVERIEKICRRKKIRAVYVTSHHHNPTTVSLCPSRRMKLLALAEKFGFIVLEDDYDFDFHYQSSPIFPLASADKNGMVVYIGTLSKTISPAVRVGYVAAPKNLIDELCKVRQIIDIQGDHFLEQAVAELFSLGEIRRHLKKAAKEYHMRRDYMCALLQEELSDFIDFKIPDGGLSIWAKYNKRIALPVLTEKLRKQDLILSNGLIHEVFGPKNLNATRMGFGWLNVKEAERAVSILKETIGQMIK